ncbi:MAG: hypothetical protein ACK4ML_00860 [Alishewanella aestuarii]
MTKAFREQIRPLMDRVIELATQNDIAFSSIFQVDESEGQFHFSGIQNIKNLQDKVNLSPELLLVAVTNKAPSEAVQLAVSLLVSSIEMTEAGEVENVD